MLHPYAMLVPCCPVYERQKSVQKLTNQISICTLQLSPYQPKTESDKSESQNYNTYLFNIENWLSLTIG